MGRQIHIGRQFLDKLCIKQIFHLCNFVAPACSKV